MFMAYSFWLIDAFLTAIIYVAAALVRLHGTLATLPASEEPIRAFNLCKKFHRVNVTLLVPSIKHFYINWRKTM